MGGNSGEGVISLISLTPAKIVHSLFITIPLVIDPYSHLEHELREMIHGLMDGRRTRFQSEIKGLIFVRNIVKLMTL